MPKKGKGTVYRIVVRSELSNRYASDFEGWVCPVSTDSLPLGHSTSSQANLFVL
jgi:hypothetical protein